MNGPTPQNPSRRAMARVQNPLPIPRICPHCGSAVTLVDNSEIYGASYGDWPYAYRCQSMSCDSHVGLHPYTNLPLGTLAQPSTRAARTFAKQHFNPIWKQGDMTRSEAYEWLAKGMGLEREECHLGLFSEAQCATVIQLCKNRR